MDYCIYYRIGIVLYRFYADVNTTGVLRRNRFSTRCFDTVRSHGESRRKEITDSKRIDPTWIFPFSHIFHL